MEFKSLKTTTNKIILMKKNLLLITALLISSFAFSQDPECVEIFISEYVEGWSNNKAIELYNPTDEDVDLANYRLERYSNGSTTANEQKKLDLGGIMPPFSVYVIVIDKRDSTGEGQEAPVWDELQAKADTFMCPVYNTNNVMYFNGNDAMVLKNTSGTTPYTIDRIGQVGVDPFDGDGQGGWNDVLPGYTTAENGAEGWTKDHSLIRKSEVLIGDLYPGNEFNVSVEWDSIPPTLYDDEGNITGGNWTSLGEHYCDCGDAVNSVNEIEGLSFNIYPNPAVDNFMIESESKITELTIYSISGSKMYTNTASSNKFNIQTSEWTSGYYIVNLKFENGYVISKKVLVE